MGVEARRAATGRTKKASPPYFSHEFIITNHGDIMSCILMLIVVGLMFQVTLPFSQMLIVPQYNTTFENNSALGKIRSFIAYLSIYRRASFLPIWRA
jgi:translocating chain-associated membrane protein 1